jgi:tyrosine-protein kinase shark
LIEYYSINLIDSWTRLKDYVKKDCPPIITRRHGISNLLHRATKHNQLTVVNEMLKMSYRNLDAKDEHGMTAVHLSCKHRVSPEILQLLIERGANVSTRDSSGNTPLHVR